jgi:hypothetical protein
VLGPGAYVPSEFRCLLPILLHTASLSCCKPYHRSCISLRDSNDSSIMLRRVPMQESESILSYGSLSGIDIGIIMVE